MWLYGEILHSLPVLSKRILIDLPLKAPHEEVRYSPGCGGFTFDEHLNRTLIWRTKSNHLELYDYSPTLSVEAVLVQFPRHVQILPYVSISQTNRGLLLLVISQASFHLIELINIEGASLLSDLTASSFKKTFYQLPIPLSIIQGSSVITEENGSTKAVVVISAKNNKAQVYSLAAGSTIPHVAELKSQSMFGRLLWSSCANDQPRVFEAFTLNGTCYVLALCQDKMFRMWNPTGDLVLTSQFAKAEKLAASESVKFCLRTHNSENELKIYLQINNSIYRATLSGCDGDMRLNYNDSIAVPNVSLNTFCVFGDTIWVKCEDEEDNEFIKVGTIPDVASSDCWRDVSLLRVPPEEVSHSTLETNYLLQNDVIADFALRRALCQMTREEIPNDITAYFIEKIIAEEEHSNNISREDVVAQLYSIILEYHFDAIKFSGFVGGNTDSPPIILRQNSLTTLRPLTIIETVCSGYSISKTGPGLGKGSEILLNGCVLLFNKIIFGSGILEEFEEKIASGTNPLDAAYEIQNDLDLLIIESDEMESIKEHINELKPIAATQTSPINDEQILESILLSLFAHLECSPITRDSMVSTTKCISSVTKENVAEMKPLANAVRSFVANMLNLSELLLILVVNIINSYDMVNLKSRLSYIVSDYNIMQWVCNSRGIRSISKKDGYMSSISLSTKIVNQSQSTLIGDSFVSLNNIPSTLPQGSEEPLLELWMAQQGSEQMKVLAETVSYQNQFTNQREEIILTNISIISQLICPKNRLLTIPGYLLETNQIDLLSEWLELITNRSRKYMCSYKSSVLYLKGVCCLHNDNISEAVESFAEASGEDLREDFMATYVLKNYQNQSDAFLRTTYYLEVIEKFKGYPNEQIELSQAALNYASPTDDRISMLWTKVFKLNLELEHYPAAYSAMISNTDDERRRDCLRNFVLHLSENGDLAPLVEAPYGGLEEEISSILENRALAVSAHDTRYFDLLYAFHITKNNYRQAAKSMYLHATKLKTENDGSLSVKLREASLLATINCLSLAQPEIQWIAIGAKCDPGKSPKRDVEGEIKLNDFNSTQVVTLEDIENELKQVQARLLLADNGVETFCLPPIEISSLLCKHDFFNEACKLLTAFNIEPVDPIAALARKYACAIGAANETEISQQLTLLLENRERRVNSTTLYRSAAHEILKLGHMIPSEMLENYKKRDMNEILRLLTKYGEIEEAVEIAVSILSRAKLSHKIVNNKKLIMNVPVQPIEQLNYFMKLNNHKMQPRLQSEMMTYLDYLQKTLVHTPTLRIGYTCT